MIKIISPENGYEHSLHTDVQKEFLRRNKAGEHISEESYNWLTVIHSGNLTHPAFLQIGWISDKDSHIEISLYPDMRDNTDYPNNPVPAEIEHKGKDNGIYSATIKNMFAGVTYYYKAVCDDGSEESDIRTFITKGEYPRLIAVEGITNVRDLGLLPTFNGKRIKQGRIYRGVALENTIDDDGYALTVHGKTQMEYLLGIKNELEIRKEAKDRFTESMISPNVGYNHITTRGYDYFYEKPEMVENRRKLIEFFADENNYPIYFHCAIGADRTGTLAMFLEMLLGVKKYYLNLDYNLTSLTQNNLRYQITEDELYQRFSACIEGEDCDEVVMKNCERFLIESSGVSPETIVRLRQNLLE